MISSRFSSWINKKPQVVANDKEIRNLESPTKLTQLSTRVESDTAPMKNKYNSVGPSLGFMEFSHNKTKIKSNS